MSWISSCLSVWRCRYPFLFLVVVVLHILAPILVSSEREDYTGSVFSAASINSWCHFLCNSFISFFFNNNKFLGFFFCSAFDNNCLENNSNQKDWFFFILLFFLIKVSRPQSARRDHTVREKRFLFRLQGALRCDTKFLLLLFLKRTRVSLAAGVL